VVRSASREQSERGPYLKSRLERIVALALSGAVLPPEIKRYPLSEAAGAHAMSEGRHLGGKVVFDVR
jgi:hypothetical protein